MTLIRPRTCILRNTLAIAILVLAIGPTGTSSVRALISGQTATHFVVDLPSLAKVGKERWTPLQAGDHGARQMEMPASNTVIRVGNGRLGGGP